MLQVDLHSHTFFSACGLHTHVELLTRARELGVEALAITDHGPALGTRVPSSFYERLSQPVEGVRLLKGVECNVVGDDGEIDLPRNYLHRLDVVLLGFHHNTPRELGERAYTRMLIRAIERNPAVDILVHPHDTNYPVDFPSIAQAAAERGVAVELNNSKTRNQRIADDVTRALVEAVKQNGAKIVINSDTHALDELGCDDSVKHFLVEAEFPGERLVSASAHQALEFIERRRRFKRG